MPQCGIEGRRPNLPGRQHSCGAVLALDVEDPLPPSYR